MKKRFISIFLTIIMALGVCVLPASAKTAPSGQTVDTVLFYMTNAAGERILVSQIPVTEMEADMAAGRIDNTLHNYSVLDRYVTTVHQEAQGFLVSDFVAYAQGKSTDADVRSLPLSYAGEDKIAFWEIDQTGYDDMDTYTYNDLYGVERYNFPLLYEYWDYTVQDYYDPAGKMSRDQVIDYIFANGKPEVFLLSVRAFSQRYMITDGKYGTGDYNMENLWNSQGLLDNERTIRLLKPMTEAELRNRMSTASDTRYWVSQILLDMQADPALPSKGTVAAPTATMTEDAENYYIRFSCDTPGAAIYYNHNYISPSYMPTALYEGGTVTVPRSWFPDGTVTMTVHAVKDGYSDAGVVTLTLTSDGSEAAPSFTDVSPNAWYAGAVEYVVNAGLFSGTGKTEFSPDTNMTRAMLVTVLWRLEGQPAVSSAAGFGDVKSGSYYADAVAWASENNIVTGVGSGKFDPDGNVTREQIATILYRYLVEYKGLETGTPGSLDAFSDGAQTSSWAKDAMEWAVSIGLFQGSSGKLTPKDPATRAQVATLMQRVDGLL